ncbi:MAG: hypothetical protein K2H14_08370, partial [Muribaculaceae bacterium]|nr:hypothetical protein [Muribaculaceae bacterium]
LSSGKYVPNTMASAAAFFNRGFYTSEVEITISDHQLTLLVNKPHTKSGTWFCFDNFKLTYLGETAEEQALYDKVKRAIDDAAAKAEAMGYYNYSNHVVEERYELRNIVGDGDEEVRMTYIALANAAKSQNAIPADMRYVIFNNSFEMGGLDYWTVSGNASVSENASSLNADGIFTLQTSGQAEISQSTETFGITLPNGIYELKALLSDGATLTANGYESSPAAGGNPLSEVSLRFPVNNGTASFGAKGDSFTADNFTLTRLADADNMAGYEKIRVAMADATVRANALGAPYADGWDLSAYQAILDSFTLEGDGTEEFNEIYALLRERVALRAIELGGDADLTDAIINPSFEMGKPWGWNVIYSSDTGVMPNSNDTYYAAGCHGDYLFNTWWQGTPVTQTIEGLPAGHYRLEARVASDNNAGIYLTANGEKELKVISGDDNIKKTFFDIAVEFDLAAGEPLTIGAVGSADDGEHTFLADGHWWYKADDFRLTLISATVPEHTVTLAFEGEYDTLILPFDHEIPSGLEVYSVPGYASEGNDHKVLSLEQVDAIAANTPYVVRQAARSAVYEFTGTPVNESDTYTHGLLTGTHVDTVAEEGHFVLSHTADGSLFRRLATGESTSVTAGHAFISDPDAAVSFLRFTDNGGSTGIEAISLTDDADVDIYNAAGILLRSSVPCAEALRTLAPGIYLIRQGDNVFKIAI